MCKLHLPYFFFSFLHFKQLASTANFTIRRKIINKWKRQRQQQQLLCNTVAAHWKHAIVNPLHSHATSKMETDSYLNSWYLCVSFFFVCSELAYLNLVMQISNYLLRSFRLLRFEFVHLFLSRSVAFCCLGPKLTENKVLCNFAVDYSE